MTMSDEAGTNLKMRTVGTALQREVNTLLMAAILAAVVFVILQVPASGLSFGEIGSFVERYVGPAWPFFAGATAVLGYAAAALLVAYFDLGGPRNWRGLERWLHWTAEASPSVGLLSTFVSLAAALQVYSQAGPGSPESQAAFIAQFGIATGSTIVGGVLGLVAFTLHRLLPEGETGELR